MDIDHNLGVVWHDGWKGVWKKCHGGTFVEMYLLLLYQLVKRQWSVDLVTFCSSLS